MKLFKMMKDGGPLSKVWGYFLVDIKPAFSVVFLKFIDGSREAYHSHAFGAISWVLRGRIDEHDISGTLTSYTPSWKPIYTPRDRFHKVVSRGTTWAISFRGPWSDNWKEYLPDQDRTITLTHGRKEVT